MYQSKLGINGENMVYLDLSHKDPHELDVKLGGIIEIYENSLVMIQSTYENIPSSTLFNGWIICRLRSNDNY